MSLLGKIGHAFGVGVSGAAAVGAELTGARFTQHKNQANTKKNLLGEAYGLASKQLAYRQREVREGQGESLVARGMTAGGQAGNTLGAQQQSDTEGQLGLERQDLDLQRRRELAGIKADYTNQTMGDVVGTLQGAASAYSAGATMGAGGGTPSSGISGAFGLDPLHATPQGSVSSSGVGAPGTPNYNFSVPSAMGY